MKKFFLSSFLLYGIHTVFAQTHTLVQQHDSVIEMNVLFKGAPPKLSYNQMKELQINRSINIAISDVVVPSFPKGMLFIQSYSGNCQYKSVDSSNVLRPIYHLSPGQYYLNKWVVLPIAGAILMGMLAIGYSTSKRTNATNLKPLKKRDLVVGFGTILGLSIGSMFGYSVDNSLPNELTHPIPNTIGITLLCSGIFCIFLWYRAKKKNYKQDTSIPISSGVLIEHIG